MKHLKASLKNLLLYNYKFLNSVGWVKLIKKKNKNFKLKH